jgi:hypothetical protein
VPECINPPFGISAKKAGYIPARMALVNCMIWPERSSRMRAQALSTAGREESIKLCNDLDQFIAAGFDNQPFMKGLSPKLVEKLYGQSGLSPQINIAIAQQWSAKPNDCARCSTPTSFYTSSIASRKEWNVWLADLAKATKSSDAILVPLLIHYAVAPRNERGLIVMSRSAYVAMLLIDTTTGELIWTGGRESEVVSKAFAEDPRAKTLQPPDVEELKRRLFTDALWLGFPGRQVYK